MQFAAADGLRQLCTRQLASRLLQALEPATSSACASARRHITHMASGMSKASTSPASSSLSQHAAAQCHATVRASFPGGLSSCGLLRRMAGKRPRSCLLSLSQCQYQPAAPHLSSGTRSIA